MGDYVQEPEDVTEIQGLGNTAPPIPRNIPRFSYTNGSSEFSDEAVVISLRGGCLENKHKIHAAVVDGDGKLLYSVGDPSRMTLARSAAKPFQTLAILETGAADKFHFDDEDVALVCASHSSEPRHITRAQAILKKAGMKEKHLTCGGHPAQNVAVDRAWIKADYVPTAIDNNCSGKHAGMVAGAVALGASVPDYYRPEHPLQQRVMRAVEEISGLGQEEVRWAVDGCNLPAPALPLTNLAIMFARLADARSELEKGSESLLPARDVGEQRRRYLAWIHKSMSSYSGLVAGEGRFCTDLMTAFQGLLVGKVGADGCYGVGVRATSSTEHGHRSAIGIAVKVEDGNLDVLYAAVPEILEQMGIGTSDMRYQMEKWQHPPIKNTAGVVTGGFEHHFQLQRVQ